MRHILSSPFRHLWFASLALALPLFATLALTSSVQAQVIYFTATLGGSQETPPTGSSATGFACLTLDTAANTLTFHVEFSGLGSPETAAHLHGFAPPGTPAPVLYPLPLGNPKTGVIQYLQSEEQSIIAGLSYINIHSTTFQNGEIRGQVVQAPPVISLCFGDGTVATCPCGNNAVTGQGCLNSIGTGGILTASGFASIACDSFLLSGSAMPNTTAIYFQGTAPMNSGFGSPLGDGLLCAGGTVVRLRMETNTNTGSQFPTSGQASISVRGGITSPGTRIYQAWYRDPTPSFCTPANFNFTNAVQATWVL